MTTRGAGGLAGLDIHMHVHDVTTIIMHQKNGIIVLAVSGLSFADSPCHLPRGESRSMQAKVW